MFHNKTDVYEVIVVGGGHAGCEAALAASRMGCRTALLTMNIYSVAQMSCNPAIGGVAKGHMVREIDALGGEMAKAIDATGIQFRILNTSKGPAVCAPRAQADRAQYALYMRGVVESQDNLYLLQGMGVDIEVHNGKVTGVITETGRLLKSKSVILTAGTFLNGRIHVGLKNFPAGRAGEFPAVGLTESLEKFGFEYDRLKTGTPPRVDGNSIDFDAMEIQPGDEKPQPFSFQTENIIQDQLPCFLTYTNTKTHDILRTGLDKSPMFTGNIKSQGPRYCPSIEDKIFRFADKDRHQIFLEPEGRGLNEYYVNGFSTSLPEDVQLTAIRTIKGMENVETTRTGYAIEYDYFPPYQIQLNLETHYIENLFFAGQINGTTGYEEAAAQGIMAGINAGLKLQEKDPFVLNRSEAYIGVLIDDLVNKGTDEPYRMFTSRAEYRLILRQDNADQRLMQYGYEFGLLSNSVYDKFKTKQAIIKETLDYLKQRSVKTKEINLIVESIGAPRVSQGGKMEQFLKRPEITLAKLAELDQGDRESPLVKYQNEQKAMEQVEIGIKYEGYITRQNEQIERFRRMESRKISKKFDYNKIQTLSMEAREKLSKIRPESIGQASRISGVSPADISVLMVYLGKMTG